MVQFPGRKKKKGQKEEDACAGCGMPGIQGRGPPISNREAAKRLKQLEKKRAKSTDCPYLEECTEKMLPEVGQILCLDEEVGGNQGRGYMMHMAGQHTWNQCKFYAERLRQEKGVLPKDLKKALKVKKRK